MSDDHGKGAAGPAFPELELDVAPRPAKKPVVVVEEDDGPQELAMELDAPPVSKKQPSAQAVSAPPPQFAVGPSNAPSAAAPSGGPAASDPVSMGPPVAMGPPVSVGSAVAMGPPASARAPVSAAPADGAAPPEPGVGLAGPATRDPLPSASALLARARNAAPAPGDVARNVAQVGNRTSTALVMLGGAILLTVLDIVYGRITGERLTLGPLRLVWISAPLALIGAGVIGVRLLKEHAG